MKTWKALCMVLVAGTVLSFAAGCGSKSDSANDTYKPPKNVDPNANYGTPPGQLTPGVPGGGQDSGPTKVGLPGNKGKRSGATN